MLVSEVIARGLLDAGVREVFGVPGGEVLDFIEAGRKCGLPFVLARHEAAAAFMADVTGQFSGRPGACLSTLGPGATNMLTGVANAYLDRSPVIAITGQMSTDSYSQMPHQRLDLRALYRPVVKWSIRVTPQNAAAVVPAAVQLAMRRPRGPVHIELPSNVARSEAKPHGGLWEESAPPVEDQRSTISLADVVGRLGRSKRPALCVGVNVDPRAAQGPVRAFAERFGVPVLVSPKAKGVFPHDHDLFVGVATGMAADDRVLDFIGKCDLILGVGFDASEADKTWPALAPIIWIEEPPRDPVEWNGDYLVGSVPAVLSGLTEAYAGGHEWSRSEIAAAREHIRTKVAPRENRGGTGLSPSGALMAVREAMPEDGIFICDVGCHKLLAGQLWPCNRPHTFFMSNGLSSMGYGVPGAVALKRLAADRPVVGVIGDGGFAMMVHEVETAARLKQGVVYVVFRDDTLALIRVVQSRRKYERYGVDFAPTRWSEVASALGGRGMVAGSLDELGEAVASNLSGDRPVVIEVPVDDSEYDLTI